MLNITTNNLTHPVVALKPAAGVVFGTIVVVKGVVMVEVAVVVGLAATDLLLSLAVGDERLLG